MAAKTLHMCPYAALQLDRLDFERRDSQDSNIVTNLIKAQYRKLALVCHPDRSKTSSDEFQKISSAFDIIKTFNDRQNFKNNTKAVTSTAMTVDRALVVYAEESIHDDDFIRAFANFIVEKGGTINTGFDYIDNRYKHKMKSMGNPKNFCSTNSLKGFSYTDPSTNIGASISFSIKVEDQKPKPCSFFAKGGCNKGINCGFAHISPNPTNSKMDQKPKLCSYFAKGFCKNGINCGFAHVMPPTSQLPAAPSNLPPRPPTPRCSTPKPIRKKTDLWEGKTGHKKVIVVGGSGHGKSTFINSMHNFFTGGNIDNLSVVIPTKFMTAVGKAGNHSESHLDSKHSQTQRCHEYTFMNPANIGVSITFVDTPGLADTRGAAQDDANMNMVLQAAANAEAEGTLSAVVFVMAAGTKRNSLSIETIGTILKCSLPDAILENLLVAFSSAPTMDYANEAARVVPFDVLMKNRFNFDNPVFQGPLLKTNDPNRALYEMMWTATMTQMANIVNAVFRNKTTKAPLFREMLAMRMKIKTSLNDIRMNIANLQAAQRHIDDADASLAAAKTCTELNTLCGACQNLCHANCSLTEITSKGSSDFCGCAAFQNQSNCLRCKDRCSHTEHLHGRYRFETRETTVDKVIIV
eukprot:CAMPEP_0170091362 /NCGR_PEP_ID=MMETSP0019_2-20121128/24992_1 /TAXON_ID=98059 /ORGANISM="Dinobryon sp., Strain UTEXLB2267" /LENGTH=634 /DNA_ID=CAMNT_0010311241 /DNA_START=25 /DNA_END=1929 /DNA_ORIENTATION=-